MTRTITLVRHPPVDVRYRMLCYGSTDVLLGPDSTAMVAQMVATLALQPITQIVHSGLRRAAILAEELALRVGTIARVDVRLQERHFGDWELQSWDEIYANTGDAMMGMVNDPSHWRPPGGETTFELRDRVLQWYQELSQTGHIVAICHGGPIAALLGTLRGLPVSDWPTLIPKHGEAVRW
jgi:broad specificity phosphatase PhoE